MENKKKRVAQHRGNKKKKELRRKLKRLKKGKIKREEYVNKRIQDVVCQRKGRV